MRSPQTRVLVDALSSSDPERFRAAIEELTDQMVVQARAELHGKRDRVDLIPESVAQSVIVHELGNIAQSDYESDEHLAGRLRLAIRNKIRTRLRKGGMRGPAVQSSQLGEHTIEPEASGIGPGTHVSDMDERAAQDERFALLHTRLIEGLDPNDQQLVELCVLQNWDARRAAEQTGLSHDAARARLSRMRKQLRAAALEPVRTMVSANEWGIVHACLIERLAPAAICELFGMKPEQVASVIEDVLSGAITSELGPRGIEVLHQLLGRAKN